jgi:hypothetical protein
LLIVRNRANKRISLTHGLVAKRQYRGDSRQPAIGRCGPLGAPTSGLPLSGKEEPILTVRWRSLRVELMSSSCSRWGVQGHSAAASLADHADHTAAFPTASQGVRRDEGTTPEVGLMFA